jgi:hypothetical protein
LEDIMTYADIVTRGQREVDERLARDDDGTITGPLPEEADVIAQELISGLWRAGVLNTSSLISVAQSYPCLLTVSPQDEQNTPQSGYNRNWHEGEEREESTAFPGIEVGSPVMHILYNLFTHLSVSLAGYIEQNYAPVRPEDRMKTADHEVQPGHRFAKSVAREILRLLAKRTEIDKQWHQMRDKKNACRARGDKDGMKYWLSQMFILQDTDADVVAALENLGFKYDASRMTLLEDAGELP